MHYPLLAKGCSLLASCCTLRSVSWIQQSGCCFETVSTTTMLTKCTAPLPLMWRLWWWWWCISCWDIQHFIFFSVFVCVCVAFVFVGFWIHLQRGVCWTRWTVLCCGGFSAFPVQPYRQILSFPLKQNCLASSGKGFAKFSSLIESKWEDTSSCSGYLDKRDKGVDETCGVLCKATTTPCPCALFDI